MGRSKGAASATIKAKAKSPGLRPGLRRSRDQSITAALEHWFSVTRRAMPWRPAYELPRDPYAALVSEFMLQQTQVSRVLEFFPRFMAAFPTVEALARADERRVMALWAGLGYYRRARNLHAAAKMIVERFGGQVPREIERLRELPGVGRYTAGSIASIVFGQHEPALDGNVMRVVLRVEGRDLEPSATESVAWAWARAGELVRAATRPGVWNEGLMELGAMVCVPPPGTPKCSICPIAKWCEARKAGTQDRIPRPKRGAKSRTVHAACAVAVREIGRGRTLRREVWMEQRGDDGLWAGLWQPPCVEHDTKAVTRGALETALGVRGAKRLGVIEHQTTAKRVRFAVFSVDAPEQVDRGRWVREADLAGIAISTAHWAVLEMAGVRR